MIHAGLRKRATALMVAMLVLAGVAATVGVSGAQDTPAAKASGAKQAKKPAKFRGRLPAYYSKVVDQKQREQIYAIQKTHNAEITKLRAQLKDLIAKRNTEVVAVLSAEQKAKLAKLIAAAKANRKKPASKTAPKKKTTKKVVAGE